MATSATLTEQRLGLCLILLALPLTTDQELCGPFMLIMMVESGMFQLMLPNKGIGQAPTQWAQEYRGSMS